MRKGRDRVCLNCGMTVSHQSLGCPKCDAVLSEQTDGSTLSCDIAHHGERVSDALTKLDDLLEEAKYGVTAQLRLIVGSGLIRDEVNAVLGTYLFRNEILSYEQDGRNTGSIIVRIRK